MEGLELDLWKSQHYPEEGGNVTADLELDLWKSHHSAEDCWNSMVALGVDVRD
jgi:hypothetical protein